jgi:endogenous inhibitor of DNA gyrase (YacG/DUF329 family)
MARKRTSPIWDCPTDQFRELVSKAKSISEVLRFFGLQNHGSNSETLKTRLTQEKIEYGHLLNHSQTGIRSKIPLSQILVQGSTYARGHLKKRLLNEGLLKNECTLCGALPIWQDRPLVLILDHINGVNNDNRLTNLRLVCPNCNSQLPTFAGRAARQYEKQNCPTCGKSIGRHAEHCPQCANKAKRIPLRTLSDEELASKVWEVPVVRLAQELGISDVALRKRCLRRGIQVPGVGYWQKRNACVGGANRPQA